MRPFLSPEGCAFVLLVAGALFFVVIEAKAEIEHRRRERRMRNLRPLDLTPRRKK